MLFVRLNDKILENVVKCEISQITNFSKDSPSCEFFVKF